MTTKIEPFVWINLKFPMLTIQLTKPDEGGSWEPAFTEFQLADAVAAERERCAKIVEDGPFAGTRSEDAAAIWGQKP